MNHSTVRGYHNPVQMASAITSSNLQIGKMYTLSQHSIFRKPPVQRKLYSDLLKHWICLNEGCVTHGILFYFVKTQLSVPALETIQLINNLMEVSCLLLSPLTWSLPPLFPKETLASPLSAPTPTGPPPSHHSTAAKFSQKEEDRIWPSPYHFPDPSSCLTKGWKSGPQQPLSTFIPVQPQGESSRLFRWPGEITIPWNIVL